MKQIFLFFILCCSTLAHAQVSFYVTADAKQVTKTGYLEVRFVLENARGEQFRAPDFQSFRVMSGPSQSMSTSIINGVRSSEMSYVYVLQPTKVGKQTIGRASVRAGGKTYRTDLLQIEVVESKNPASSAAGDVTDQVFLRAEIEADTVYIGQQIPLNYRIYTLKTVNSYNILRESEYQGFYAEDLRRFNAGVVRENINGEEYTTKILKRVALFPQQTGIISIDPMQMQVGIAKGGARNPRDFFFTPNVQRINIAAPKLDVEVMPLPPDPPLSFGGAVGQYSFSSGIDRRQLSTDDALTIRVRIVGNGDVKRVQAPVLDLGSAFELYEPKVTEGPIREINGGIQSVREYEYLALPKAVGEYRFQLAFTYFNPETATYETIPSEEYRVVVTQGNNPISDNSPLPELEAEDIRGIKASTVLQRPSTSFFGTAPFWGLSATPLLLFLGVLVFKQVKKRQDNIDPLVLKSRMAQKVAQQHLSQAKTHLEASESRSFYDAVSKAMVGYVNDKLNIPNSRLTKDKIIERLQTLQVSEDQIKR
ncbi:MAG: BatD family protein, partial [Bacteroidota bacterium]